MDEKTKTYFEAMYNTTIKNYTDRLGNPIYQVKEIRKLEDCVEVELNDRDNTILQFRVSIK